MATCVTTAALRRKNIRHLYYGTPAPLIYRTSGDYPNFDQLRLQKHYREEREKILKSSKSNYTSPELEPAVGFRSVSAAEAKEISERLHAGHNARKNNTAEKQGNDKLPPKTPKTPSKPQRSRSSLEACQQLHTEFPYAAQVRVSRDPVKFIGRHKHVNKIAQPPVNPTYFHQ